MTTAIKIIILAAISAALAIVAEQLVAAAASTFLGKEIVLDSYTRFTWFLVLAAVIEEISKYWAIYFIIRKKFELAKTKFVVASFFLGMLWGAFEIALVLFSNQEALAGLRAGNPDIVFSFSSIIALHSLTALLMGISVSIGQSSGWLKHWKAVFFPILIHLLFNFLIIQKGNFTNYLTIIVLTASFFIGISVLAFNYRKLA
jgi:hypothetical protein